MTYLIPLGSGLINLLRNLNGGLWKGVAVDEVVVEVEDESQDINTP